MGTYGGTIKSERRSPGPYYLGEQNSISTHPLTCQPASESPVEIDDSWTLHAEVEDHEAMYGRPQRRCTMRQGKATDMSAVEGQRSV